MNATPRILEAYWESTTSGLIILAEDWSGDDPPPLFFGPPKQSFASLEVAPPLVFGSLAGYTRLKRGLVFCLHPAERYRRTVIEHGAFVAGPFNDWDPFREGNRWRLRNTKIEGHRYAILPMREDDLPLDEEFLFKFRTAAGDWIDVAPGSELAREDGEGNWNFHYEPRRTGRNLFTFTIPADATLSGTPRVLWSSEDAEEIRNLPPTPSFLRLFSDAPLGALPGRQRTVFRVFAPRASAVTVEILRPGSTVVDDTCALSGPVDGVWEGEVNRDLTGHGYYLRVEGTNHNESTFFDGDMRLLDPYARAAASREGPGLILGEESFPPEGIDPGFTCPRWDDLVVCECHVADLLARLPERWRRSAEPTYADLARWIRSGQSYLHELGVNAVEFQPLQENDAEHRHEYHWGYMPVNYFAPESRYATDPDRGSQVREFRDLVAALHEEGFAVLLDVVYNHVGLPNNLLYLDKFYYFRLDRHQVLENWSGCGNDLRTEAPMVRRLIRESLLHLVEQYGIDGFRFDLAELIGLDCLAEIEATLKRKHPSLVLITEPWSFRGSILGPLRSTGYASWNDGYREFLPEYCTGHGNRDGALFFLAGSPGERTRWPAQTVNYSESHDDYAWLDRITENPGNDGFEATATDRRRTHLMFAFLFASLGIPMLSAGQDGLRTKFGVRNTYQRADLNAVDYERRIYYSATARYVSDWIRFRRSGAGRLLRPGDHLEDYLRGSGPEHSSAVACLYNAAGQLGPDRLLLALNPHPEPAVIPWPQGAADRRWTQIADHERLDPEGLRRATLLVDRHGIHLPGLSAGLWQSPGTGP